MKTNFKIALIKTLGLIVSFTLGFLFGTLMGEIIDYLNIENNSPLYYIPLIITIIGGGFLGYLIAIIVKKYILPKYIK